MDHNERYRFGSAQFASKRDIRKAGLFKRDADAMYLGSAFGKPLWDSSMGGGLIVMGARAHKWTSIISQSVCASALARPGTYKPVNIKVILDPKGQAASVAMWFQHLDGRPVGVLNPTGLFDLPQHSVNILSFAYWGSPTLISDIKVIVESLISESGSAQAIFFESRAREFLEALAYICTRIDGVLSFPRLYHAVTCLNTGGDDWLNHYAFEMSEADAPHVRRAEAEIAQGMADGSSSGYRGVIAELTRAFSALSDPNLMRMLSPPYDLSLEEITEGAEPWMVFCCVPAEAISPWAPILRSLFEAAKIHKARRPDAPRQVWILDECAQLKKWRLISDLFTYGAGIGIRPWAIYQSEKQMLETISNGDTILPASAAVRIYGGIRDLATATTLSRMIGNETRGYDDTLQQSRARQAKRQAIMDIIDGGDPFEAMMRARHQAGAAQHRSTQPRPLRTADEVLNTPLNKAYVFVDGLEHPIDADRTPYWRQRGMTTHVGDPYHPPIDETRFMIRWGERTRYVITEPAADYLTHLPQFKGGLSKRLSKTRPRKGSQANGRRHEGHAGKRTQPKRLPAPDKLLPKP